METFEWVAANCIDARPRAALGSEDFIEDEEFYISEDID